MIARRNKQHRCDGRASNASHLATVSPGELAGQRSPENTLWGEVLLRDLANQLLQRCASLWNVYGPTETTVWSTIHQVDFGDGSIPIECPIANTQIYILDPHVQPVPIWCAGSAIYWRRWLGPRLSQSSRVDRREVHSESLQQRTRAAPLQNG